MYPYVPATSRQFPWVHGARAALQSEWVTTMPKPVNVFARPILVHAVLFRAGL